jgi:hypothetical protein
VRESKDTHEQVRKQAGICESPTESWRISDDLGPKEAALNPFSKPRPTQVVIIRDRIGREIDRVEDWDLCNKVLRNRNWQPADLSGVSLDGSDLSGTSMFLAFEKKPEFQFLSIARRLAKFISPNIVSDVSQPRLRQSCRAHQARQIANYNSPFIESSSANRI